MKAGIRSIDFYLPAGTLNNEQLSRLYPEWTAQRIEEKTGIRTRHISAPDECASDLGVNAARRLFSSSNVSPTDIDYVIFCTQSPDFFLPATACLIQNRLGIPINSGAVDINQGCSGFVVGLGLATGLVESGQANRVLLITADTYTKFINPKDQTVRTLFGDGAAACLVQAIQFTAPVAETYVGPFNYGTDGSGANNLIVQNGGMRCVALAESTAAVLKEADQAVELYMNGPEIFNFTLKTVPAAVRALLSKASLSLLDIDLFVFHQANLYMLEHLRKKLDLPAERFVIRMSDCGNTVSSSIPIALKRAENDGQLRPGQRVMLVGFGVGYSWAGAVIRWVGSQNLLWK